MPWAAVGGTELATLRVAEAARSHGYRNILFHPGGNPAFSRFIGAQGFETVEFNAIEPEKGKLAAFLGQTLWLAREFRRRKVDLVHCAELLAGDQAAVAARLAGKPLVCHVRNRYDWLTRFQRFWLLAVDRLVFVSRHTKARFGHLARQLGSVAERAGVVVYDGFSAERPAGDAAFGQTGRSGRNARSLLDELGIPAGAKVVGMVARMAGQKDHATLVQAASQIVQSNPNIYFLLVGGCGTEPFELKYKDGVMQQIAASAARDRIIDAGFRSDVPRVLEAIDVFVLATHFEGLPLVILEAMAHGKPVVATAVDGIPEVVIDGKTGLLHRHQDAGHLAAQLAAVLTDDELAHKLGRAGCAFVEQHFSQAHFVESIGRLYHDVLRRKGRGRRATAR